MTLSNQAVQVVASILLSCVAGCGRSASITPKDLPQYQVDPAFYKSFYSGRTLSAPETLSGAWEADDGQWGAVGIELTLTTSLPDGVQALNGGLRLGKV